MASEKTFHMTPEEFRRHGHTVVDWIADYYARIESSRCFPGPSRGRFGLHCRPHPPLQGEPFPSASSPTLRS